MKSISPYRTDPLAGLLTLVCRRHPVYVGFLYFVVSFCGLYGIGIATGRLNGTGSIKPMYSFIIDNISLGLLAPIGAGLLCHLYNCIVQTLSGPRILDIIPSQNREGYNEFLRIAQRRYDHVAAPIIAFLISVSINVSVYFSKTDSWLGVNGGLTAIYGRFFITANYFMIVLILYKCAITVWALRRILQFEIAVQPLHPDGCGGLSLFGRTSLAINYFVTLILIFFALLFIFDPYSHEYPILIFIYTFFYLCAPILLFAPLAVANRKMRERKDEVLEKLNATFSHHYQGLRNTEQDGIFSLGAAENVAKAYELYQIAEKMPVWPFDIRSLVRFFGPFVVPAILFVVERVVRLESVIGRLGEWADQVMTN